MFLLAIRNGSNKKRQVPASAPTYKQHPSRLWTKKTVNVVESSPSSPAQLSLHKAADLWETIHVTLRNGPTEQSRSYSKRVANVNIPVVVDKLLPVPAMTYAKVRTMKQSDVTCSQSPNSQTSRPIIHVTHNPRKDGKTKTATTGLHLKVIATIDVLIMVFKPLPRPIDTQRCHKRSRDRHIPRSSKRAGTPSGPSRQRNPLISGAPC